MNLTFYFCCFFQGFKKTFAYTSRFLFSPYTSFKTFPKYQRSEMNVAIHIKENAQKTTYECRILTQLLDFWEPCSKFPSFVISMLALRSRRHPWLKLVEVIPVFHFAFADLRPLRRWSVSREGLQLVYRRPAKLNMEEQRKNTVQNDELFCKWISIEKEGLCSFVATAWP